MAPGWMSKRGVVFRFGFAGLVAMAVLTLGISAVFADKPDPVTGHDHGNDEEGEPASLDLIACGNGIAKWKDGSGNVRTNLTYRILDISGGQDAAVSAVGAGVQEWDVSVESNDSPYTLTATSSVDADVTIRLFFAIAGPILGSAVVPCDDPTEGIQGADITMRTKGLNAIGLQNVSAHEFGHALGLLHADTNKDIMGPRFERKEQGKHLVCPSNLDVKGLNATTGPSVTVTELDVPALC